MSAAESLARMVRAEDRRVKLHGATLAEVEALDALARMVDAVDAHYAVEADDVDTLKLADRELTAARDDGRMVLAQHRDAMARRARTEAAHVGDPRAAGAPFAPDNEDGR